MNEVWTPEQYRAHLRGGEIKLPGPDAAETLWQAKVEQLFRRYGWLCYHAKKPKRDQAGFLDLWAVHFSFKRLVIAELKTKRRKVTDEQQEWIDALIAANQEVYIWRLPEDWQEVELVARGQKP